MAMGLQELEPQQGAWSSETPTPAACFHGKSSCPLVPLRVTSSLSHDATDFEMALLASEGAGGPQISFL